MSECVANDEYPTDYPERCAAWCALHWAPLREAIGRYIRATLPFSETAHTYLRECADDAGKIANVTMLQAFGGQTRDLPSLESAVLLAHMVEHVTGQRLHHDRARFEVGRTLLIILRETTGGDSFREQIATITPG